jgi:hypothetical protein
MLALSANSLEKHPIQLRNSANALKICPNALKNCQLGLHFSAISLIIRRK